MDEQKISPKRGKGGRPAKTDTATNCVMVRFTDRQYADFMSLFEQSGVPSRARFILARIFGDEFRVVTIDGAAREFVTRLTALHGQIRSVGVNYNQIVKQLHTTFGADKAMNMLYKLEQETIDLSKHAQKVLALCDEFRAKNG